MEISTVGQCVLELILNSLDARTTGVAVRIHSEEKRIQVVDCGAGIPPDILTRIGEIDKKNGSNSKILGYNHTSRGKSLKQILQLSQICIITSTCEGLTETYEKVFKAGESPVFLKGNRPAKGTAVTICGFQGSEWDSALNAINFAVKFLALIYTNVSFTLHDQVTGQLVTGIHKPHEPYDILNSICGQLLSLETTWHLNSIQASGFKISGYVGFLMRTKTIAVRQIFINRRSMMCYQIEKLILETMNNLRNELQISTAGDIYFLLYIECPLSDFILSSYAGRTFVVFQSWHEVLNSTKACIINTIKVDYNKFMKAESSKVQETAFKSSKAYASSEQDHPGKKNNPKVEKSNREETSNILNRKLEEKVAKATLPISSMNQNFLSQKQSEDKIPIPIHTFMFPDKHKNIFVKELESKEAKAKQVLFFKKNHKEIFGKLLEDQNTKAKQVSFFKKNHKNIFVEKLEDKKAAVKKIAIFKRNRKDIFGKLLENKQAKAKQFSILERIIDLTELKKLNNCRAVVNRIRKREQFSIEDGLKLFDKSFLKNLMTMKNRILKNQIKTRDSIAEEASQPNREKANHLNQETKNQQAQEESKQPKIQEHKTIRDFGKTQSQFLEKNQNLDVGKNQIFSGQKKSAHSSKAVDAGEKVLELDILNVSAQKIDPEPCSQLSEWSDWNYDWPICKETFQLPESKKVEYHRLYHFLPIVLNPMLRFGKTNIISEANMQQTFSVSENVFSAVFNPEINPNRIASRYQNLNVRHCVVPHSNELKLNRKSLDSIQILRQINLEFIVAITIQDGKKLLLIIDQHAADERIRYEDLLHSYRIDSTKQYFSILLYQPILITDIEPKKCKSLLSNEKLVSKFGIRLKSDSLGSLIVTNIPRCFLKKKSFDSDFKMACSVRNLLLEIVESLQSTNGASILPRSIHNAIASEACRGAVKFGDPLTIDQCNLLIQSLIQTNAPNRCAHGRPSIIPLLDVTDLKKKQTKSFQGKLNFVSLKRTSIKK